jgi:hypothetical protein
VNLPTPVSRQARECEIQERSPEIARLQAENDKLTKALTDLHTATGVNKW